MKIVEINAVPYGSTGKIAKAIAELCSKNDIDAYFAHSWTKKKKHNMQQNEILIGGLFSRTFHTAMATFFNCDGFMSKITTNRFIRKIKKINPDIIHLHIMHSFFINIDTVIKYAVESNVKLVWTFHDCWMLTGGCMHFLMSGCKQYKTGCNNCAYKKDFSKIAIPSPSKVWTKKYDMFNQIEDMVIITPSDWLASIVRETYLNKFDIRVINNGINLNRFKPTESDFREKYNIVNKYIVLGVAFGWSNKKGLDIFIKLSKLLDERYAIILVGTDSDIEKELPKNIISIRRTQNQDELVKIYSSANVFVNPTREDTFPTVNIEALACGTPVVTFDVGGSPEIVTNECGRVIRENDINSLVQSIKDICEEKNIDLDSCINRAHNYEEEKRFMDYVELFKEIC